MLIPHHPQQSAPLLSAEFPRSNPCERRALREVRNPWSLFANPQCCRKKSKHTLLHFPQRQAEQDSLLDRCLCPQTLEEITTASFLGQGVSCFGPGRRPIHRNPSHAEIPPRRGQESNGCTERRKKFPGPSEIPEGCCGSIFTSSPARHTACRRAGASDSPAPAKHAVFGRTLQSGKSCCRGAGRRISITSYYCLPHSSGELHHARRVLLQKMPLYYCIGIHSLRSSTLTLPLYRPLIKHQMSPHFIPILKK
ncbi:hypothetical protein VUR80DRAFT_3390 [Thermomyces stellatus]